MGRAGQLDQTNPKQIGSADEKPATSRCTIITLRVDDAASRAGERLHNYEMNGRETVARHHIKRGSCGRPSNLPPPAPLLARRRHCHYSGQWLPRVVTGAIASQSYANSRGSSVPNSGDGMVWYGKCRFIYSAIITKVSNALNTLVSGEKPGFQTLSEGLIVLLCAEVVRQRVPDNGAVHSECSASNSG